MVDWSRGLVNEIFKHKNKQVERLFATNRCKEFGRAHLYDFAILREAVT